MMKACLWAASVASWRPPARSVHMLCRPGEVVGIDLGTTSSAVAVVLGGEPEIVPDEAGRTTMPSLVDIEQDLVGHMAVGTSAIGSTKRLLGRSYADVKDSAAVRALFGKELAPAEDGSAVVGACSPVAAASALLERLMDVSEAACGVRASKAVLTVPAHFTEPQRAAMRLAAERAGLAKCRLLEEPVAAALAYGVRLKDEDELVMVFDLGGGTLDVSLLRVGRGTAEVLSSAGEPWLGGDDFDLAIAKHISSVHVLVEQAGGGLARRVDERSPLVRQLARLLKERCTVVKVAEEPLPMGLSFGETGASEGGREGGEAVATPTHVSLSRAALEAACADLLGAMRRPVIEACTQAQVALPGAARGAASRASTTSLAGKLARAPSLRGLRINTVLRVGAASRMPAVGRLLEALVGVACPIGELPPEHAVALGAAVQAGVLEGSIEQLDVFNPLEAALIRGIGSGAGQRTQRERTGVPSGSRKNGRKQRRSSL